MQELWKETLSHKRLSFDRRGLRSCDAEKLQYLIYLSQKYVIDPYDLLKSLFEAEKRGIVRCGSLNIELRMRAEDHAIFLFTKEQEIVAQMKMKNVLWENRDKTTRFYSKMVDYTRYSRKLSVAPSSIVELHKGMTKINLRVKVTEKSEIIQRYSRYTGNPLSLCVVMVSDSSGSIRLPLWENQINMVSLGDEIEVKNARVKMFKGLLQIVPSRKEGGLIILKSSKPTIAL